MSLSISVAMCTFNGRPFLRAQLDSIASQTRPPAELVVCDDGSSDGSDEMVREFSRRVPFPTHLVINTENLGSTRNFEKAISLCQSEIVALADQDDIWYAHKLERMEEVLLRSGTPAAVFSDADLIDDDSRLLGVRLWDSYSFDAGEQRQFSSGRELRILLKHSVITGATMAFRRQFLDFVAPIPPRHVHDGWISFLLAARGRIEAIQEPLMQYRRHRGQQIGPGGVTMRERVARAQALRADVYLEEAERFQHLYERLEEHRQDFPNADFLESEIKKKIAHSTHRACLPSGRIARIPKILRKIVNRSYWRYSGGWRSVARDLMVRG